MKGQLARWLHKTTYSLSDAGRDTWNIFLLSYYSAVSESNVTVESCALLSVSVSAAYLRNQLMTVAMVPPLTKAFTTTPPRTITLSHGSAIYRSIP